MKARLIFTLAGVAVLTLTTAAPARTKLTTLPERETVRIDIQNGRYMLVEEERTVNLQAGRNQVDFSWANINIDKDSIVFRVIRADGEVIRQFLEHYHGERNHQGLGNQVIEPGSEVGRYDGDVRWPSGRLRQAFVIDPHVHNFKREPDPANPVWGKAVPVVTCEDFIETIGDWWGPSNKGTGYLDRAE
jgi:hypothetical protein